MPEVLEFREDHFKGLYDYVSTILKIGYFESLNGLNLRNDKNYVKPPYIFIFMLI